MDKSKEGRVPWRRGLSAKIRKLEQQSADWLERSTRHYTRRRWKILLAFFIMAVGGISAMLLIGGLTGELENAYSLERITKAINANALSNKIMPKNGISETEWEKLGHYRTYLDSLRADPAGLKEYEQIIGRHPGLVDTLDRILGTYQSQIKHR